jgi:hypothetical protein
VTADMVEVGSDVARAVRSLLLCVHGNLAVRPPDRETTAIATATATGQGRR